MTHQYEYQGVRGLSAISKAFNISYSTLLKRIQRGLSIEEAVSKPRFYQDNQCIHVYNGVNGIKAIAELTGISKATIYARMKQGNTLKEAVEGTKQPTALKMAAIRKNQVGVRKPDLMSPNWALALGISI
ncbi:hypothetical protein QWY97_06630 [Vibrio cortegadensis]|uniref:helix-turn-helix transcriptional regulator n=1 Tax=Vibrio cortegadensis TaxID=1328770 RepID=UPI0021C3E40A|nr:hypothetical protein [Vibrio cortegadensis]MDN3697025.1 hypothetical protein [Vibrio cortegadensis]